jgi:hypothetical protein
MTIRTIFPQTINRNSFEAIWEAWHFCYKSELINYLCRLFKIEPVCEYLLQNFRMVYSPGQGMILWRGCFIF